MKRAANALRRSAASRPARGSAAAEWRNLGVLQQPRKRLERPPGGSTHGSSLLQFPSHRERADLGQVSARPGSAPLGAAARAYTDLADAPRGDSGRTSRPASPSTPNGGHTSRISIPQRHVVRAGRERRRCAGSHESGKRTGLTAAFAITVDPAGNAYVVNSDDSASAQASVSDAKPATIAFRKSTIGGCMNHPCPRPKNESISKGCQEIALVRVAMRDSLTVSIGPHRSEKCMHLIVVGETLASGSQW